MRLIGHVILNTTHVVLSESSISCGIATHHVQCHAFIGSTSQKSSEIAKAGHNTWTERLLKYAIKLGFSDWYKGFVDACNNRHEPLARIMLIKEHMTGILTPLSIYIWISIVSSTHDWPRSHRLESWDFMGRVWVVRSVLCQEMIDWGATQWNLGLEGARPLREWIVGLDDDWSRCYWVEWGSYSGVCW